MKRVSWLYPVLFCALFSGALCASEGVDEIIRLQQGGVNQRVLLAFVENSATAYDPSAAEIQKMEDAGVGATVIVAMIDHGKALRKEPVTAEPARAGSGETVSAPSPSSEPRTSSAEFAPTAETVVYAPPKEEANISFFYQSMAPYGEWHRHSSYGWVWQPRVVSVDTEWRPYAHGGHWVWTDHGWYWESTYPWGWAAFHYGRWHRDDRLSWVWVPDTEWGPSWVHWRSSDEAYAWAPLPPEARYETGVGFNYRDKHVGFDFHFGLGERDYSVVPTNSFLALDVGSVVLRPERARNVYNKTTIVNNTYVYNDNRIINNGVSMRDVSTRTNTRIETVSVSDSRVAVGQPIRGEVRNRDTIVAYRPTISRAAPKDPPTVIQQTRVTNNTRVVNRERVDADAESRLAREKSVRQNTSVRETRDSSRDDDSARRRLGLEKQRREAETGESRKVINTEVKQEHQDDIAAEREARRKLNDEKSRRDSGDKGRDNSDKRDNPGQSRRETVVNDDDDARGKDNKADKESKADKDSKGKGHKPKK